jgi:hypothetical protein
MVAQTEVNRVQTEVIVAQTEVIVAHMQANRDLQILSNVDIPHRWVGIHYPSSLESRVHMELNRVILVKT